MTEQWQINKPIGECFGTGRKIEAGEDYFAALVEVQAGFQRHDFCAEYWESQKPQVFCYWKTRLAEPDKKKQLFVDDKMLMSFFDRLAAETEQARVNFRFVLALILMRRRRLKYDSSHKRQGQEVWRLRKVGDNEFAEVINPHLDHEQTEQLGSQLGQILQVDL